MVIQAFKGPADLWNNAYTSENVLNAPISDVIDTKNTVGINNGSVILKKIL
jgi:hypothetical protein